MENIVKLEQEFEVVVSLPWEGNSLVLGIEFEEALKHFSAEGNDDERKVNKLLNYILENYPNARLCEIRTKKGKLLTTLSLSSKGEVDRLCADATIKLKAIMPEVSVLWEGGTIDISKGYEDALNYFTMYGGSDAWKALTLIKHLKSYESVASLKRVKAKGKKLCATLRFSARDKEDFDSFCEEHS